MEMYITVSGKMIKLMDMESTTTLMVPGTKAGGSKTSSMERAKRFGQTTLAMKDNTKTARNMAMESSCGPMGQPTLETSLTITSTVRVSTPGQTGASIAVYGTTIRCTVLEFSPGTMDVNMRVNTSMTKSRVRVCSHGQMVANTTASGKMVNSMESASTFQAKAKLKKVNGQKESASSGLMKALRCESFLVSAFIRFKYLL